MCRMMTGVSVLVKQLLSLLVTICVVEAPAIDLGSVCRSTSSSLCNENESLFYVELKTDDFPGST